MLLTRDKFRESVFSRDSHACVICKAPAVDAHHIIERRLFGLSGGYYLDNGASVCEKHHIECEQTKISCEQIREACGIKNIVLPEHLYKDQRYDKWGNPILDNGMRLKGELFNDESVQKIIFDSLRLFTNRVKYPRTYHLPWSPGMTDDDRAMKNVEVFQGKEVVVTLKLDGENTTFYKDGIHARSIEYHPHPSRDYVRSQHARIAHDIPEGWRVCGENLYAVHSIKYDDLSAYFQVFSVWNEKNECLNWDETQIWADLLGTISVPVLYRGIFDFSKIASNWFKFKDTHEGYVIRLADKFHYRDFRHVVGKYVRANHVRTQGHWSRRQIDVNSLKK